MADDLLIQDLGQKGDGVHRSQQGPVFVERALPGERVQANVHKGLGGVLRGDLIQVIEASPHRIAAPCPNYDFCGGCTLQHADETFYRNWKVGIVRTALQKVGLEPSVWAEPVFLPAGLRRRVTFAALKKKNVVTLGYHRRRTHQLTDIAVCLIAEPKIMDLRAKLVSGLAPILQDGKAVDVFIQTVGGETEVVITGPIGKAGKLDLNAHEGIAHLVHALKIARVSWRLRERAEAEVLLEVTPLRAKFGALDVVVPPLAFLQPTKAGEDALVGAVLKLLPKSGKFADLFSGCGTFAGSMLEHGSVDAYENNAAAIRALGKARGTTPLKVVDRDLFQQPLRPDEADRYDAIVFDPPRAGAHEQVKVLASSKVPRLIGVSCDPATFARDARILVDGGYRLESITVVDQFTWSNHVELVACFIKQS